MLWGSALATLGVVCTATTSPSAHATLHQTRTTIARLAQPPPFDCTAGAKKLAKEARERSKDQGRNGCCYKSADHLENSAPPRDSPWARNPTPPPPQQRTSSSERSLDERPDADSAAAPSALSKLAATLGESVRVSKSDVILVESGAASAKPARFCKFDAVRDSLAASRSRRARQGFQSSGSYLDSTVRQAQ